LGLDIFRAVGEVTEITDHIRPTIHILKRCLASPSNHISLASKKVFFKSIVYEENIGRKHLWPVFAGVYTKMYVNKLNQNSNTCPLLPAHAY
jgi:hypothetical protein